MIMIIKNLNCDNNENNDRNNYDNSNISIKHCLNQNTGSSYNPE